MTERPLRDILAESMRSLRRPGCRPVWADCDDLYAAQWLDDAGHLMRLLAWHGVKLARAGEPSEVVEEINTTFWRHEIGDGMAVYMRADGDRRYSAVYEKDGKENSVSVDLVEGILLAGRVIYRDETVKAVPGVLTKLAIATSALWRAYGLERPA